MTDYDKMRERHHNGMCGGDCPECYSQQREEAYREQEREYAYELAREAQRRDEERLRSENPDISEQEHQRQAEQAEWEQRHDERMDAERRSADRTKGEHGG